jgi:hypothetical protein
LFDSWKTHRSNALDALIRIAAPSRSLFGRPRLAASSPAMLAALTVLANRWANDARAAAVLKRALKAHEAEVRAAAEGKSTK